jgi:hypothetical protein
MVNSTTMTLEVEDFTGQVRRRANDVPKTTTVYELIETLRTPMQLPDEDAQGRQIQYSAIASGGEMLNATDQVGDVLDDDEVISLTKAVTAGGLW